MRYGPLVGVVGSTLIFALAHGVNGVFPAALVVGLIAGEVFRRSGLVWLGVVIHAVVNLPTVFVLVLIRAS
ncbi:CPBP family intramembrane glutamic endopeptidase [Pseudanabaena sp. FACHB-2040]|uniref:CPBP family intramembrane glutamic endopeptidase n=1 Tax=Pseudanabaena sp. FACHB-2040 TaxID=2692859 RepID=UPI001F5571A3|nr:CPBP family intramembrane glutamic endopeptidase [Pseudanabaena sp. FACHB-2040]